MSIDSLLNSNLIKWMDAEEKGADIVISSRVRLARNLKGVPFPHLLDTEKGNACMGKIINAWEKVRGEGLAEMDLATFDKVTYLDRQIFVEKQLCSPAHAENDSSFRGLMVNNDGSLASMINEEDHLRIQCLLSGLNLDECCKMAQKIDDAFEQELEYAFDERRGYLTSCPTNVGTGMRASVMLHLPAIQVTGQSNQIFHNISQLGMTVRGIYGEGTEALGNFFQLSNQITLGQTEEDICKYLYGITMQIVEQEKALRENLKNNMKYQFEDKVGRAFGILSNACLMNSKEALALLSDVRLGVDMGMIKGIQARALNELMVAIRPSHLQKKYDREMDAIERDIMRAEVIKEKLKGISD